MTTPSKKQRRLIPEPLLKELHELYSLGVPVSKLTKELNDITNPVLTKLLVTYSLYIDETDEDRKISLYANLFPKWLDNDVLEVQACPLNCKFDGYWPQGKWQACNVEAAQ